MRKKILIYSTSDRGHHLEYIHHLHEAAVKDIQREYIFAVPLGIKEKGKMLQWTDASHVGFRYLLDEECISGNGWKANFSRVKMIKRLCMEFHPTDFFLITLMAMMPFLAILNIGNIKFSGIVYNIYLYDWKQMSMLTKIKNIFIYGLLTKLAKFKRIFILNDSTAVAVLNKVWHTGKFVYLPDPIAIPNMGDNYQKPDELPEKGQKTIFLHAGGMDDRKGTLEIFEMMSNLTAEQKEKTCFVFAGSIAEHIRTKFFEEYERLKQECNIVLYYGFCDYDLLISLCWYSSYLLLPYKNTSMSSGIIAYGANCGTPVIVPNRGLLGKLVKRFKLGICLKGEFNDTFLCQLDSLCANNLKTVSGYIRKHTISDFTDTIIDSI